MAHTLGNYAEVNSRAIFTTAPASFAFYCNSGSTLLTLSIVVGGASIRSGTAPTYGGSLFTQANSVARYATSPECTTEMWYLLNPTQVTSLRVNIPTTAGSRVTHNVLATALAQPGWTSVLTEAKQYTTAIANPGSGAVYVTTVGSGSFIVDRLGHGGASVPTGRNQTLLINEDHGAYVSEAQYALKTSPGSIGFSHTIGADDAQMIVAAFAEIINTPPTNLTGSATLITNSSAVLGGETTQIWTINATARGFVYGINSQTNPASGVMPTSAGYTSVVSFGGSFPAETFVGSVSGLTVGSTHYFRAWSQNSFGYGFGLQQEFLAQGEVPFAGSIYTVLGSGSAVYTGEVTWAQTKPVSPSGLLTITGSLAVQKDFVPSASGVLTITGSVAAQGVGNFPASGLLTITGSLEPLQTVNPAASGILQTSVFVIKQITLNGEIGGLLDILGTAPNTYSPYTVGDVTSVYQVAGSGLLSITGDLVWSQVLVPPASGLLTITGSLGAIQAKVPSASGLLTIGGSVGAIQVRVPVTSGLLTTTGSIGVVKAQVPSASGLLTIAGSIGVVKARVPSAPGLLTITGSVGTIQAKVPSASGLLTTAGSLGAIQAKVPSASGLLTIAGSLGAIQAKVPSASGLLTITGSLGAIQNRVPPASGLLIIGGDAPVTFIEFTPGAQVYSYQGTGLIQALGQAGVVQAHGFAGTGPLLTGGTGSKVILLVLDSSGAVSTGGSATEILVVSPSISGKIQTSGAASVQFQTAKQATGGISSEGFASQTFLHVGIGTGVVTTGGTAAVSYIPITGAFTPSVGGVLLVLGSASQVRLIVKASSGLVVSTGTAPVQFWTAKVSQANIRLSLAADAAFVDFSTADLLTPYLNRRLTITDSAGKKLVGYIKAAGSGETYGSELSPNTNLETTDGVWSYGGCNIASIAGGESGNCLQVTSVEFGNNGAGVTFHAPVGSSILGSFWGKTVSGWWVGVTLQAGSPSYVQYDGEVITLDTSWTRHELRGTTIASADPTENVLATSNYTEGYSPVHLLDTISIKQVLTPSTTGVTITSTPGGSSYNWESEESGFNRNDPSGYIYEITSAYPGTGILQASGGASVVRLLVKEASGGLQAYGTGYVVFSSVKLGSGVVEIGGTASSSFTPVTGSFQIVGAGSAVFTGTAFPARTFAPTGSGTALFQGEGKTIVSRTIASLGILTTNGNAGSVFSKNFRGSGSFAGDGAASSSTVKTFPIVGGGTTGGEVHPAVSHGTLGSGGFFSDGFAPQAVTLALLGVGQSLFSGTAPASNVISEVAGFPAPLRVYTGMVSDWYQTELDVILYSPELYVRVGLVPDYFQAELDVVLCPSQLWGRGDLVPDQYQVSLDIS